MMKITNLPENFFRICKNTDFNYEKIKNYFNDQQEHITNPGNICINNDAFWDYIHQDCQQDDCDCSQDIFDDFKELCIKYIKSIKYDKKQKLFNDYMFMSLEEQDEFMSLLIQHKNEAEKYQLSMKLNCNTCKQVHLVNHNCKQTNIRMNILYKYPIMSLYQDLSYEDFLYTAAPHKITEFVKGMGPLDHGHKLYHFFNHQVLTRDQILRNQKKFMNDTGKETGNVNDFSRIEESHIYKIINTQLGKKDQGFYEYRLYFQEMYPMISDIKQGLQDKLIYFWILHSTTLDLFIRYFKYIFSEIEDLEALFTIQDSNHLIDMLETIFIQILCFEGLCVNTQKISIDIRRKSSDVRKFKILQDTLDAIGYKGTKFAKYTKKQLDFIKALLQIFKGALSLKVIEKNSNLTQKQADDYFTDILIEVKKKFKLPNTFTLDF